MEIFGEDCCSTTFEAASLAQCDGETALGAVHIVRTQQGGEGGSPKCVQMRAGGRGVFGALSAHARDLYLA